MTTQEVISYWCDGDKRLCAQAATLIGKPHDGPPIEVFVLCGPRTVALPHDFLAPAELQAIALIESRRAPGNMGTTGGSVCATCHTNPADSVMAPTVCQECWEHGAVSA